MAAPRAVFLTPVLPRPGGMGLAMRAAAQLTPLMRCFAVTVIVLPVAGAGGNTAEFHRDFPGAALEVIPVAGREDAYFRMIARLRDPAEQLLHFARYGRPSLSAAVWGAVAGEVAAAVARCGASHLHVFRSYLAAAADRVPAGVTRSIDLDEDDAASIRSSSAVLAQSGQRHAARLAVLEAEAFERIFARGLASFRVATLANPDDVRRLSARHPNLPLRALPNAVAVPPLGAILPRSPEARATILFVGSLRYQPNVDGLLWFIGRVLPLLPGVRLRVAGARPAAALLRHQRAGRVEFPGYVADLAAAYRAAALAIAPMRSGGGTRIKVLEAGAHGVPVVAAPEAVAGLWPRHPAWGLVAAPPRHVAAACRRLLGQRPEAQRLGLRGRAAVSRHYAAHDIGTQWFEMFQDFRKEAQQ